jgi:hypothetical protein
MNGGFIPTPIPSTHLAVNIKTDARLGTEWKYEGFR